MSFPCQIPGAFLTLQGGHIPLFPMCITTNTGTNDYFMLDNQLLLSVHSCSCDAIVISDHVPVILEFKLEGHNAAGPPWRLKTRLLSTENFVNFISQQIDYFLSLDKTPDVSMSVIWEVLKAYLRGEIISISMK